MLPKQHSRCCCRCQLVFQLVLEQLLQVCIPHKTTYDMAAPDGRSRGCKVSCRDRWHLSTWSWLGRQKGMARHLIGQLLWEAACNVQLRLHKGAPILSSG